MLASNAQGCFRAGITISTGSSRTTIMRLLPQMRHESTNSSRRTSLKIGMIPADGIGREVIPATQRVLEAAVPSHCHLTFVHLDAGFELFQKTGVALPEATLEALKSGEIHGAMFGAVR